MSDHGSGREITDGPDDPRRGKKLRRPGTGGEDYSQIKPSCAVIVIGLGQRADDVLDGPKEQRGHGVNEYLRRTRKSETKNCFQGKKLRGLRYATLDMHGYGCPRTPVPLLDELA